MKLSFRWFGEGFDSVSLKQIRQIPGMQGKEKALVARIINP